MMRTPVAALPPRLQRLIRLFVTASAKMHRVHHIVEEPPAPVFARTLPNLDPVTREAFDALGATEIRVEGDVCLAESAGV
jgi:BMFP domain-containing protein YqiC